MKEIRLLVAILSACFVQMVHGQDFYSTQTTTFRSSSAMVGSGSAYAPNPSLNADGTANYNAPSYAPSQAPGVRYAPKPTTGDNTNPDIEGPIGDAVLPLLLLAMAYAVYMVIRRRRQKV